VEDGRKRQRLLDENSRYVGTCPIIPRRASFSNHTGVETIKMKKHLIILSVAMMLIVASLLTGGAHSLATTETLNQSGVLGSQAPNATCTAGDVGGTVFRELPVNGASLNTYGLKDGNEPGVEGVTVTVIDANGTVLPSVTTNSDGAWVVSSPAFPVRVEFTVPSGLAESPYGTDSPTSVQFVSASDCSVDFGVHYPDDYSDTATPLLAQPRHENGQAAPNTDAGLFSFTYDASGLYGDTDNSPDWLSPPGSLDATFQDIGATWGLAYQREEKRLFVASFLRRHSGLANGLNTLYILDYTSSPPAISTFDVSGAGIDLGSIDRSSDSHHTLPANDLDPSYDIDAFPKVGTVGFGDIEVGENGRTLWAVNLNQQALIQIDISGATPVVLGQTAIGDPGCTGGTFRPFGLKFYRSKGYVGGVCDAGVSKSDADLTGYVLSFDPANPGNGFSTEISFSLDYRRDTIYGDPNRSNYDPDKERFRHWIFDWADEDHNNEWSYPEPMLSGIEFGPDGSMYLGIADRWAYQGGRSNYLPVTTSDTAMPTFKSYGEFLKVCRVNGAWVMEGDASGDCPVSNGVAGFGVNGVGEFFDDTGGDGKKEFTEGALALLAGSGDIVSSMNTPYPGGSDDEIYWSNDGAQWFSLADGNPTGQFIQMNITNTYCPDSDGQRPCGMGKAAGVGDIELLTAPAPLEIGNRLWCDTGSGSFAGNGVQDPKESAINGATVVLECDTDGNGDYDVSASVTTDANGLYLFKDGDASLSSFPTAVWDSNLHIIPRNTSCRVLVDYTQTAITDACGPNSIPTTLNNGQGANADLNDSDGDPAVGSSNQMGVVFTTGASGENDHSFDFGFQQAASLGDFVWWDLDEDGLQDANETGIEGVTVHLQDPDGNEVASTLTDAGGHYLFDNLVPGDYTVVFDKPGNDWNLTQPNQGNDSSDSDADPASGQGPLYSLQPGEKDMTIDAGLTIPTSYTISKENTTVTNELVAGDPISFTIVITNTGKTWLSVVPLKDTYDTTYLTYVDADPASDDNTDDGEIVWSDLTLRFGNELAPGESFTVVTHFTARQHTQDADNHETINTATVFESQADPDGPNGPIDSAGPLDEQSDDAPVSILYPVGESMVGFWAERTGCSVRLWWQTASEADILGFNVLRNSNGRLDRLNESLIFAHEAGADVGSLYRMIDRRVPQEQASYILEIVHLDGRVERYTGQSAPVVRQGKRSCRR